MRLSRLRTLLKMNMKQKKLEENKQQLSQQRKKKEKFSRKRSQSFTAGFNAPPYYRYYRRRPMLPTKFLLGGNISDPLNLNSLRDEEINRTVNAVTPKSSPIPTPPQRRGHIEVIIPPNINDPLNLIDCQDDAKYVQQLTTTTTTVLKKCSGGGGSGKRRKKKKRTTSTATEPSDVDEAKTPEDSARIPQIEFEFDKEVENATELKQIPRLLTSSPILSSLPIAVVEENTLETDTAEIISNISTSSSSSVDTKKRKIDALIDDNSTVTTATVTIPVMNLTPVPVTSVNTATSTTLSTNTTTANNSSSSNVKEINVKKLRRLDSMDKIVSPVVPQPGSWSLKRSRSRINNSGSSSSSNVGTTNYLKRRREQKTPTFKDKNKTYQYGNYNRYYGYRNSNHDIDPRLRCFANHTQNLFAGKDILDIGCNIGHITLTVARDFNAKSIIGLDIDKKLIGIARKNIRHYVNCDDETNATTTTVTKTSNVSGSKFFPISMPILYGPVDVIGTQEKQSSITSKNLKFPHNVTFVQGNYILLDDSLLAMEKPQFDIILCLSITKWLHLNWGDTGLKQAFRRMYAQLRPGGKLILEPQSWTSYKGKKKLTETIYRNYNNIKFFPEKFTQYLLSSEVGFAKSEMIGQPQHVSKGFQRPIQVFTKSEHPQQYVQKTEQKQETNNEDTKKIISETV